MDKEKINKVLRWVNHLEWSENDGRTDATLKASISPFVDCVANPDMCAILSTMTKGDYLSVVESLCIERTDCFHIDSVMISMDGDVEETRTTIEASIHLAE